MAAQPTDWHNQRNLGRMQAGYVQGSKTVTPPGPMARAKAHVTGKTKVDDGHQGCNIKAYTDRRIK